MTTLEKIPEYIVATMVLHNICILKGDLIDDNLISNQHKIRIIERDRLMPGRVEEGNLKRQRIMKDLIIRI